MEGGAVSLTDCDHGRATRRKPLRRWVSLITLGWKAGRNQQRTGERMDRSECHYPTQFSQQLCKAGTIVIITFIEQIVG